MPPQHTSDKLRGFAVALKRLVRALTSNAIGWFAPKPDVATTAFDGTHATAYPHTQALG